MDIKKISQNIGIAIVELFDEIDTAYTPTQFLEVLISLSGFKIHESVNIQNLKRLSDQIYQISNSIKELIKSSDLDISSSVDVINSLKELSSKLEEINEFRITGPTNLNPSKVILDWLILNILEKSSPKIFELINTFQLIDYPGIKLDSPFMIDYPRLSELITNPVNRLYDGYLKEQDFFYFLFFKNLQRLFLNANLDSIIDDPSIEILRYLNVEEEGIEIEKSLYVILDLPNFREESALEVEIHPLIDQNNGLFQLFIINPSLLIQGEKYFDINEEWEISFIGDLESFSNTFILGNRQGISFAPKSSEHQLVKSNFEIQLRRKKRELADISEQIFDLVYNGMSFGVLTENYNKINFFIETGLELGINLKPNSGGDGFLNFLIPGNGVQANLEINAGWLSEGGLYFNGQGGLETTIPIHKSIGPLNLKSANIYLGIKDASLQGKASVSFSASLGIVNLNVDKVGFQTLLQLGREGNLGGMHLKGPEFLFPEGVGAALKAAIISGGGFLDIDKENSRYAGGLSLTMFGQSIDAVGLIATKLPNGKEGFSMLVSMNLVFMPAIQLSFGFTWVGVGGLIGINRTMKVDEIRKRLSDGAINSIMFPENLIENADKVISDLRAIFPPKEDHYVVAPFIKLGFGTPSIIEVDLGIMLEFPFAGRIILLGSLGIYLPTKETILVEIHIDILGDFNFAEHYIRIEGRLRNSHILTIPLKGGFAFMLDWGRRPAFLFSIGGYHPRYRKPARFPDIPRLSAVIRIGGLVKITAEYYQAITSNSFQIGFSAFMKVSALDFSLEGSYAFHAMLQFNPFFFSIEQGMSVKLKYKSHDLAGIALHFLLSGPSPWTATGYAEISILFITVKIRFRITWGDSPSQPRAYMPVADLQDLVKESLTLPSNWVARLPENMLTGESLRPAEDLETEGVILHPSGYLQVRQTVLPFNYRIEKFGNSYVRQVPTFSFDEDISIGNVSGKILETQYLKEPFARGQFEELSKSEQLSSPDFEDFLAGLSFGSSDEEDFDLGGEEIVSANPLEFECIVLDNKLDQRETSYVDVANMLKEVQRGMVKAGTSAKSQLVANVMFDDSPLDQVEAYQVVSSLDQSPFVDTLFPTYGEANQFVKSEENGLPYRLTITEVPTIV